MHWHVLGAGAMGCLFASFLRAAGQETTLVLRESPGANEVILKLERDESTDEIPLAVCTAADPGSISHLLVSTKAYDVHQAVMGVAHRLDHNSKVLLMTNGMGLLEELHSDLPWLDIYQGATTEGAYRVAPWHICHAGRGQTRMGQTGMREPPDWFTSWRCALATCTWNADIDAALWRKLTINCAINPLTAVHRCSNGELTRRAELTAELSLLCGEIARVSTAAGYPAIADQLETTVMEVVANTANNRSSMLQDVLQGKPTEIDYITGHLVKVAGRYQVPTPLNNALLEQLHALTGDAASH